MRTTHAVLLATLAVTACRDASAPVKLGPVLSAIVRGQNQTVIAKPDTRLPEPVVNQLYRMPSGALAFRRVPAWERMLLPSPYFTYGTKAGLQKAEIRGTVANLPVVFDTVVATVKPDKADPKYWTGAFPYACSPAVVPADAVRDVYGNAVPYRIVADGRIKVLGDTVGSIAARTITFDSTLVSNTQYIVDLRGAGDTLVGRLKYWISAQGCANRVQIGVSAAGVNATP